MDDTFSEKKGSPGRVDECIVIKRYLRPRLLLPTMAVVLGTAGLGIALIAWIVTHKTTTSLAKAYSDGAFLLDEGTVTESGLEAGRLIGLTISSAASTAIGLFTPIFMGLYAYRTAFLWTEAKRRNLPTPLQYGLILDALGGAGIISLFNTSRYLLDPKRRRKASPMLVEAFAVAVIAYLLVHAVSAVDLWLHTVTSSVIEVTEIPSDPSEFGFLAACLPDENDCLWNPSGFWQGGLDENLLTLANQSTGWQGITVGNSSGMGVIVKPNIPQNIAFRIASFGARASCQSLNPQCDLSQVGNISCSGFPPTFPPAHTTSLITQAGFAISECGMYFLTATCPTCDHIGPGNITASTFSSKPNTTTTYSLWLQLVCDEISGQYLSGYIGYNTAMSTYGGGAMMLANCSVTFYNVTLDYRNGSYSLVDEEVTNTGQSDAMSVPLRMGIISTPLVSAIEGTAFRARSADDVMSALSENLARLAAASAQVAVQADQLTMSQSELVSRIVGRYPFWPVIIILILLFLYAGFALFLCVVTAFAQTEMIPVIGKEVPVAALDLAVLRLTDHVAIAAELFPEKDGEKRAECTIQTDAMEMHREDREPLLRLGLHKHGKGGETIFGFEGDDGGEGESG